MPSSRIGIVACSSPVGLLELELGLKRLREAGFEYVVHPNVTNRYFVNAGTDDERAQALLDYAFDDSIDVLWCARGGYGAARVVSLLHERCATLHASGGRIFSSTATYDVPKPKLLVGYSDVTILHEYVRQAWDWKTLHAPMVAASKTPPTKEEWNAVDSLVRNELPAKPYTLPVRWLTSPPSEPVVGDLIGGNLSLWASLAGTPWQPNPRGRILFFEDLGEPLYRLDRMVVQLEQANMLEGAAAIVLGDFADCNDEANTMLDPSQPLEKIDWTKRVPLRPTLTLDEGLLEIFGRVAKRFNIPLAAGLPVGHGPNFWPLMLGESHRLTRDALLMDRSV
jgi:muramoyltetrapeptide carboxypeptidase